MKILLAHNFYQQAGGEDQAFRDEGALLEAKGHQVLRYTVSNDVVARIGKLKLAKKTLWNTATFNELSEIFERERPAVVHFMNTFPLISPSAYKAARRSGVAVVQEVQNYRLVCPGALLAREGKTCELCLHKTIKWPAIVHRCYRDSRAVSAIVTGMLGVHRVIGTWKNGPDAYIAVSQFVRRKLSEGGIPADKILVKGNFITPDPGTGLGGGGYAAFVGRLTRDKGLPTLLKAWDSLRNVMPLKVIGAGPEEALLAEAARNNPAISVLGKRPMEEVLQIVGDAAFLVFPSEWYEGQPKVILEAFARGTPVISSNLGSMTEMIRDEWNGLLFEPGNPLDLADKVKAAISDPAKLARLRRGAREAFEQRYTAEQNYGELMSIYREAIENSRRVSPDLAVSRTMEPLIRKD